MTEDVTGDEADPCLQLSTLRAAISNGIPHYSGKVLLTISADIAGADLGYLLHKNPARVHSFELPFGKAHVFYPEISTSRQKLLCCWMLMPSA